jgi:hypothetical protein
MLHAHAHGATLSKELRCAPTDSGPPVCSLPVDALHPNAILGPSQSKLRNEGSNPRVTARLTAPILSTLYRRDQPARPSKHRSAMWAAWLARRAPPGS